VNFHRYTKSEYRNVKELCNGIFVIFKIPGERFIFNRHTIWYNQYAYPDFTEGTVLSHQFPWKFIQAEQYLTISWFIKNSWVGKSEKAAHSFG